MADKIRKDVDLTPKTIKKLKKLANKDKRKLKPYMEKVLEDHSEHEHPDYGKDINIHPELKN